MRQFKILNILAAIAISFAISSSAIAQERSWRSIGRESALGTSVEVDTIDVYKRKARFSLLRITALKNGIYLRRLVVKYGNNEKQYFNIDKLIDQGGHSPVIDLVGNRRRIRTILVEYVSRSAGKYKSVIQVEGTLRQERHERRSGPSALKSVGKTRLRRAKSKARIELGNRTGPFTEIALRTNNYPVRIRNVRVHFANGQSDTATVNQRLNAGERSGTIEFDRARRITAVDFTVRPILGRAIPTVEVLARPARRRSNTSLPSNWDKIARQRLKANRGSDTFRIGTGKGRFKKIKLRALEASVYINDIVAIYGNGERDRIPVYNELFAPDQSRTILLRGNRAISKLIITYLDSPHANSSRRANAKPVIEIYGETSRAPTRKPPPHRPKPQRDSGDWVLLGTRSASLFNRDTDVFPVGRAKGRFTKIRVTAKKHDIRMYGMRITYGNGNNESVALYGTLEDGRTSSAFDLKGRHRFIDRIAFQYRTKLNFKGTGKVELWGFRSN